MFFKCKVLSICLLVFLTSYVIVVAQQSKLEIGGFVGMSGYLGDLNKSDWFSKEPHPALGALVRYHFNKKFAARISYNHGSLTGRDSHYADRAFRNFSTESPVNELITQVEYNLIAITNPKNMRMFRPSFIPYLFVGVGAVFTNPRPILNDMIIVKSEIATGVETDLNTTYSKSSLALPFGLGVRYRFKPNWTLSAEAGFRITNSDYLDGISQAANPNKSDRYKFSGITLSYRFSKDITDCNRDY